MGLTLAGYQLIVPDIVLHDWIYANVDPAQACPWSYRAFPGTRMTGLSWPTGFRPAQEIKLNRLFWPSGAKRWTYGHFLVDGDTLALIHDKAYGPDGSTTLPLTLMINLPGNLSPEPPIGVSVWMLPPVPLARVPGAPRGIQNNLYLITLVDQRYWWWSVLTPNLLIDGQATTWASLFPLIATALGISSGISVGSISSDYRLPDVGLSLTAEPVPPVLDAIVASIGMKIIIDYTGAVRAIGPGDGLKLRQGDDAKFPLRQLEAGGDYFQVTL